MFDSYTFEFRCEREIFDIQATWRSNGPYAWQAFDSEQYGAYIVARAPELNLRVRVLGKAPNYSLEMDFDVERKRMKQTKAQLFSTMFEKLLPAVGATHIRDTSWETTKWPRRWFRRLVRRFR